MMHASLAGVEGARHVLLIAFHYPPVIGSSGWQRSLRFSQYLSKSGWRPIVLTIDPRAYEKRSSELSADLTGRGAIVRAFGLDTARHLSFRGRYLRSLATPDRWATWYWWAVPAALRIIKRCKVDAIWSTFPIATAHKIGLEVQKRTGLPWVAEFRDPMWQGKSYPADPELNRTWRRLEKDVFDAARVVVVTTPGAKQMYEERFPTFDASSLVVIENGYDEEAFCRVERQDGSSVADIGSHSRRVTIVHSGIVYPDERDPTHLFAAISSLKRRGAIDMSDLRVILRAPGREESYRRDLVVQGIDDIVRIEPSVPYAEALKEMLTVDGLLILQAANCNAQVPAKLYEYLRAGKPILALTDPAGDTAKVLESARAGMVAPLDATVDIERALLTFIDEIRTGTARVSPQTVVRQFSREVQTGKLASILQQITV